MQFKHLSISPTKATQLLNKNKSNRNIRPQTVEHYARIMRRGNWDENSPQPIILNGDNLLDGQHRLSAVIRYGKPVKFWVATGASPEQRKSLDKGMTRTTADTLRMEYDYSYSTLIAATTTNLVLLNSGKNIKVTAEECIETIKKYQSGFDWALDAVTKAGRYVRHSAVVAPLVWVYKKYPTQVETFYENVVTGANLSKNSGALRLRNKLFDQRKDHRIEKKALLLMTLSAFQAYVSKRPVESLRPSADAYLAFRKSLGLSNDKRGTSWAEKWRRKS